MAGLALALGLVAPGRSAAQAPPPADLVAVAAAYTAAWNAHDLDAVLGLFTPEAVVRVRWGSVPPVVGDTGEPPLLRAPRAGALSGADAAGGAVLVTGRPAIAAWAAARFSAHHRFVVGPYRTAGDTVGRRFREFVDPAHLRPGAGPVEGDAVAVVRGGRIALLTLVQAPAAALRSRPRRSPPGDPAAEPPAAAWPLALSGLAVLAAATAALRRRRLPSPPSRGGFAQR